MSEQQSLIAYLSPSSPDVCALPPLLLPPDVVPPPLEPYQSLPTALVAAPS